MATIRERIEELIPEIANKIKYVLSKVGDVTSLTTNNKTNTVVAINELKNRIDNISGGGSGGTENIPYTFPFTNLTALSLIQAQHGKPSVGTVQVRDTTGNVIMVLINVNPSNQTVSFFSNKQISGTITIY